MKLYPREEYKKLTRTILKDKGEKNCPFCDIKSQKDYIIWEGKHWFIQHNKFPYAGTKNHLMAIPKKCHKNTKDISSEEWIEFPEVGKFMNNFYNEKDYFSFVREGRDKSIHHTHFHFLPGIISPQDMIQILQSQNIKSDI